MFIARRWHSFLKFILADLIKSQFYFIVSQILKFNQTKHYKIHIMERTKTKKTTNSGTGNNSKNSSGSKTSASSSRPNSKSNGSSSSSGNSQSKLAEFFVEQLKDMYWADKHLIKALAKMQKAATTEELQQAFEDHRAVTEEHAMKLEQVFEIMGKKPQAKKCEAMEGLLKEGDDIIEETEEGTATRDAGLIMAAQKVEHYEIASYGTLVQLANTMQQTDAANLLEQILQEEKDADVLLTEIAENDINWEAEQEPEEEK